MINTIDLQRIFKETWGYIGKPFPEVIAKVIVGIPQSYRAGQYNFDYQTPQCTSQLGVSIRWDGEKGAEIFMPIWLSDADREAMQYLLPNTTMSLMNRKNIVTTTLANRDCTVKEEISRGDWEINIRGILVGEGNHYPEEEKALLVQWYKEKKTFNIQNARTAICLDDNEKIVITELNFPEIKGFENTQPYELKLLSDVEFSLYIS
ncbi:MAG: DUF6046 domain-containing protein [Lentimicrobiaceae bacterium]|nr:DUF6046 domain-containing protein [Lentimicrobiaceae bacterium]